jgi:AcrR family transcriptional regulator
MTKKLEPEDVVSAFNQLGYSASFGAVAARLAIKPSVLYNRYPSREALGEAWLTAQIPNAPGNRTLEGAFGYFVMQVLEGLETYRDFSRSWLAALAATGTSHLPELLELHDASSHYFLVLLDANQSIISLPPDFRYEDVRTEIADALCSVALFLVSMWETDRSLRYSRTIRAVRAVGYLIDGLLIRRAAFGDAGLLVHLYEILHQPHDQFLKPLLNLFLKPDRATRLVDPVSLLEMLRDFRSLPAQRH